MRDLNFDVALTWSGTGLDGAGPTQTDDDALYLSEPESMAVAAASAARSPHRSSTRSAPCRCEETLRSRQPPNRPRAGLEQRRERPSGSRIPEAT